MASPPATAVALRDAAFWRPHRAFYERIGVAAWSSHVVPHHATTNPRIARQYAELLLEWARLRDAATGAEHPLVVIEFGAGSGRLAHLVLEAWAALARDGRHRERPLTYVATDLVAANVAHILAHPRHAARVAAGRLVGVPLDLTAVAATGAFPAALLPAGPAYVAVIANYVLDSLPVDAIALRDGRPVAMLVHDAGTRLGDEALDVDWRAGVLAADPFPGEPRVAALHAQACARLTADAAAVPFPTTALRLLDAMHALAPAALWLIADKGTVGGPPDAARTGDAIAPHFEVHGGCVSTLLDFDVLGAWFESVGGTFVVRPEGEAVLHTGVGTAQPGAGDALRAVVARTMASGAPGEDFLVHAALLRGAADTAGAATCNAVLRAAAADPATCLALLPTLRAALPVAGRTRTELLARLRDVLAHWYDIGELQDVAVHVAALALEIGDLDLAEAALAQSDAVRGPTALGSVHAARLAYRRGAHDAARTLLDRATTLDPDVERLAVQLGQLPDGFVVAFAATLRWLAAPGP